MIPKGSKNDHNRAGKSAKLEGERRSRAFGSAQRALALSCLLAAAVGCLLAFPGRIALVIVLVGAVFASGAYALNKLRSRRLPFQLQSAATPWDRGSLGEQRTADFLRGRLGADYSVFHDVALGGTVANIDHIVIGPTGIFVLDSKNWKGLAHQQGRKGWVYGVPLASTARSTLAQRDWVETDLGAMVQKWRVPVKVAWIMTARSQEFQEIDGVDVVDLNTLIEYVCNRPIVLKPRQLAMLSSHAGSHFRSA